MDRDDRQERFERLYDETYVQLVSYCRRRCRSVHEAEEAVAASYLVAWRRFDEFEGADSPLAWLYSVAYKTLGNARRSRSRLSALRERLASVREIDSVHPEIEVAGRLDAERTFRSLNHLSRYDQELIRLVAFEELAYREIAVVVGKSEAAVRSDLYRARARLRHQIDEDRGVGGEKPT